MIKSKQLLVLVALAALWGASFLFMRVAAPEFGVVPLIGLRVGIAAVVLLPFLFRNGDSKLLSGNWKTLSVLGISNAAIPFSLFAYATLSLTAGFTSVLNSLAPMFTAAVGFFWLKQRLTRSASLGLLMGVAGVAYLVQDKTQLGDSQSVLGFAAGIGASLLYGFAANYAKEYKRNLSPIAIAGGHLIFASLVLAPFTVALWPTTPPSLQAWVATVLLAVLCTGLAHLMYFWLLQQVSAHSAVSVTFMIPMFAMFWGYLALGEAVSSHMVVGCTAILLGVALTIGLIGQRRA